MNTYPHLARVLRASPLQRAQRGVSLIFALMALVVLTLGSVALLRAVDTGMLVLGNLGFKQDALAAGSVGTETAVAWLQANAGTTLDSTHADKGYSEIAYSTLDPTGRGIAAGVVNPVLVDWDGNSCKVAGVKGTPVCVKASPAIVAAGGNSVNFVITRLCAKNGPPDSTNDCAAPISTTTTTSVNKGGFGYASARPLGGASSLGTYYRIVTRTAGVRGTVSYTETLVHF
ncbi:pilus assembly PilX family protein [Roseateles koreensis]|uniref:Tfp pilus assembly protein PilX n=1 Tax=Roseateles koreensis TaxID=2987526 RepID=A0ABT5KRH7_9BURK|nr:hypothetical protein [Roseateles koreensis]MDC8785494.1 hypothetical protein [Roseateles koreensis]